jgi:hypothetical protein
LAGCSSAATRGGQLPNVILFGEGAHGPYQGGIGNTPYTATQLAEIHSYGFGSFTMQAGLFVGQAGTSSGQPGFLWSANPVSGNASYDQQFLYGKAGEPTSISTMAHAVGLKVYLYFYLAATAPSGIAAQDVPPCAGNWSNDTDWAAWNTLMQDVGGAIAWMGFDGILLDTEVEGQNWAWTGPGGLSTHALTNTLVASRAQAWVEAMNNGYRAAGGSGDVPIYTYMSEPQAACVPGCYMQYIEAWNSNNTPVATAIGNSVYAAFAYGMAKGGPTAPVVNGDPIFYDVAGACGGAAPFGGDGTTGEGAKASWNAALNMELNGAAPYTHGGVTYQLPGFNNLTVNLSGAQTPLPSNVYLTPILWIADNDKHVWTTAEFATARPPILNKLGYNTYMIFQGKTFIDYADNTTTNPAADYTPVKG